MDKILHMNTNKIILGLVILLLAVSCSAEKIKDIVDIQGVRFNPLSGIGLVVGLADTGDSTLPSRQMLTNILKDSGLVASPSDLSGGNIAIVIVTAALGPFDREGMLVDVTVSSMEDAKSLKGGTLLPTPLKGLDGNVYAVAQGGISVSGWTVQGEGASISKNHQTVGRIPNGATVERSELSTYIDRVIEQRFVTLNLRNQDFSTVDRIHHAINEQYPNAAKVFDPGTVQIEIPAEVNDSEIASFINKVISLEVVVEIPAVVVINERTGTIVVGENVQISTVAIAQGSLVVKVKESAFVSQPSAPFSDAGSTQIIPDTQLNVEEKAGVLIPVPHVTNVANLSKLLNSIGASPSDLIAIFNALKQAGALQAKLEIM